MLLLGKDNKFTSVIFVFAKEIIFLLVWQIFACFYHFQTFLLLVKEVIQTRRQRNCVICLELVNFNHIMRLKSVDICSTLLCLRSNFLWQILTLLGSDQQDCSGSLLLNFIATLPGTRRSHTHTLTRIPTDSLVYLLLLVVFLVNIFCLV